MKLIHTALAIRILIALFIITEISSCGCDHKNQEEGHDTPTKSTIILTANKASLQGVDKTVELQFSCEGEGRQGAKLGQFKLVMDMSGSGAGKLAYQTGGVNKEIQVGDKVEVLLNNLLGGKEDDMLQIGKKKSANFSFAPAATTKDMTVVFHLVDSKDNDKTVGEVTVQWKAAPIGSLELAMEGLEHNGDIKSTNKFTIKVSKAGGLIEAADLNDLEIGIATTPHDGFGATIKGITTSSIKFTNTDLTTGGIIEKDLEVLPTTTETTFTLTLQHSGKAMGSPQTIKSKALVIIPYTLQFDKIKIDDGTTTLQARVEKGGDELQAGELSKLQLSIKRTTGAVATLAGVDNGHIKFEDTNSLTLAIDKKSASKDLTITPGTDKEAAFEVVLVDDQGNAIASTKQIIEWGNGANLEIFPGYSAKRVKLEIKNSGKIKLGANEAKVLWDTGDDRITIEGSRTGSKDIPELVVGNVDPFWLQVDFQDSTAISTLALTVKWAKLGGDVIANNIKLALDDYIAQALQGQQDAEDASNTVTAKLKAGDFTGAAVAAALADTAAQKAEAAAFLGTLSAATTSSAKAARKEADDAKNTLDQVRTKKEKEAEEGEAEAVTASNDVMTKLNAGDFAGAKIAVGLAETAAKKSEAAATFLGTSSGTATNSAQAARKEVDDARNACDQKKKEKEQEAKDGETAAVGAFNDVTTKLTAGDFAGADAAATRAGEATTKAEAAVKSLGASAATSATQAAQAAKKAATDARDACDQKKKEKEKEAKDGETTARNAATAVTNAATLATAETEVAKAEIAAQKAKAAATFLGTSSLAATQAAQAARKAADDAKNACDQKKKEKEKEVEDGEKAAVSASNTVVTKLTADDFTGAEAEVANAETAAQKAEAAATFLGTSSLAATQAVQAARKSANAAKNELDQMRKAGLKYEPVELTTQGDQVQSTIVYNVPKTRKFPTAEEWNQIEKVVNELREIYRSSDPNQICRLVSMSNEAVKEALYNDFCGCRAHYNKFGLCILGDKAGNETIDPINSAHLKYQLIKYVIDCAKKESKLEIVISPIGLITKVLDSSRNILFECSKANRSKELVDKMADYRLKKNKTPSNQLATKKSQEVVKLSEKAEMSQKDFLDEWECLLGTIQDAYKKRRMDNKTLIDPVENETGAEVQFCYLPVYTQAAQKSYQELYDKLVKFISS